MDAALDNPNPADIVTRLDNLIDRFDDPSLASEGLVDSLRFANFTRRLRSVHQAWENFGVVVNEVYLFAARMLYLEFLTIENRWTA